MILYQCDECGQIVNTAEALGPGIIEEMDDHGYVQGKVFEYEVPDVVSPDLTLIIQLKDVNTNGQFCYACMWRSLVKLIDERGPADMIASLLLSLGERTFSKILTEVPNDGPADDSSVSDNELREMHAEGYLPETRALTREEAEDRGIPES